LSSYSFAELNAYFGSNNPPLEIANDLRRANWVIISAQDLMIGHESTITLSRLLSEKQDLIRSKRVILFAFGAPYYLDATDVSKLSAYYGIYGTANEFLDVAARLLFQEIIPTGTLPVSVPGIAYDLISITSPDPDQVIELYLDLPQATLITATGTPAPTPIPLFRPGDSIAVRTSVILDHNGHTVPDGTPVRMTLSIAESGIVQEMTPVTINGAAQASFRLEKTGLMEIRAQSEPAMTSVVLQLDVSDQGAAITVVAPTEIATQTPPPTPVLTPEPSPTPQSALINEGYPNLGGWFVSIFVIFLGAFIAYWLGAEFMSQRWGMRWAFCVLLGGLIAYNLIAIGFANAAEMIQARGINAVIQIILLGEVGGGMIGVVWSRLASKRNEQAQ
jgi:beta-N-acetylhexosaminidase